MKMPIFVFILLFISNLSLAAEELQLKEGELFTTARAQLIRNKWRPVRTHLREDVEYGSIAYELAKKKFTEVDRCSMDTSRCVLFYKKKEKCLRLDTIGEHVNVMRVEHYSNECPE